MSMTDQAPPASYSPADDDPRFYRMPQGIEEVVEPVQEAPIEVPVIEKTQTELLIEEVNRAYLLQEIDLKTAAETPIFAEMIVSRREPTPQAPEIESLPVALRLIEAGDTILALREAQVQQIINTPNGINNTRLNLFDWLSRRNKPVNESEIRSFVTYEEKTIDGTFYIGGQDDSPKEYLVQFDRTPSNERPGQTEDEWTIFHVPTQETYRYAVLPDVIHKSHEGRYLPFVVGEQELFESLAMIYHDRTKSRRTGKSA